MEVASLSEQMVLLLVDKLLIGALVGIAALLATRGLERFKASLSLRGEVNKARVEHIGKLWEMLSSVHALLAELIERRRRIVAEELLKLDGPTRSRLLAANKLPPEAEERIVHEVKADVERRSQEIGHAWELLEANRFWLGPKLHAAHEKYLNAVTDLSSRFTGGLLSGNPTDVLPTAKAGLLAEVARLDIDEVMQLL